MAALPEGLPGRPLLTFLVLATAAILSVFKPWKQTPWSGSSTRARWEGESRE
jgi:hypothetical protein